MNLATQLKKQGQSKGRFWTSQEEQILKEFYPKLPVAACVEKLPNRSVDQIRGKANSLGLKSVRMHGQTKNRRSSKIYSTWSNMISRCGNPSKPDYPYYGGRGIKVCDRWLDFKNFYADMGERPANLTLDRIDPNGNYEMSNCRWVSRQIQSENQSRVVWLEYKGKRLTLAGWSRELGIAMTTLWRRHKNGITGDSLFCQEKMKWGSQKATLGGAL